MINIKRQFEGWAAECRNGQLSRRDLLRRALLVGGSVPVAMVLLNESGVCVDAAEIVKAGAAASGTRRPAEKTIKVLFCSFCNKHQDDVKNLIAGPSVCICDECVQVCNDIIADDNRFESAPY